MRIALVYIHPVGVARYVPSTRRFLDTWRRHPPDAEADLFVVCNGGEPDDVARGLFAGQPCEFLTHDNRGWDVGAYQASAMEVARRGYDLMVCINVSSYFHRRGWLRRMAGAVADTGPGLYGAHGSHEHQPHIRTSIWWLPPALLAGWDFKVDTREKAFDFEHRRHCFTQALLRRGTTCRVITWDASLAWQDWRRPPNVYRRGTQRDCLVLDRHCDRYAQAGPTEQRILSRLADGRRCYAGKLWLLLRDNLLRLRGARPADALPV